LDSVYPKPVADRLRTGERVIADEIDEAAIMMLDIVNFSAYSSGRAAAAVVRDLNHLYGLFDSLAESHGITKIKTSGDLYMAISTGPDAAERMARYALALVDRAAAQWSFRIGLNIGSAAAGVVGETRSLYDVWGDAVNLAARMEQTGERGKIQVSPYLAKRLGDNFVLENRGEVEVKGQGSMCPSWLLSTSLQEPLHQDKG
jgi:adenylate cyclase